MPDTTILSWINAEVDQALRRVHDNISKFVTAREDVALLRMCPDDLHQVSGALRMVGLSGATLVCEAIEGSFSRLNGGRPDTAAMGVIDREVLALKEFVGELSRGQANVPLKLYPVYRELSTLEGKSDASEKDLFFPDLTRQAPAHPSPRKLHELELAIFLNSQRAQFQRGVLAWLRNPADGLKQMHQALEALYQIAAQLPEPRSVWWVALGLVEALADSPEPELVAQAKKLCHKIDFHIRDVAQNSEAVNDPLLRELLYVIARTNSACNRVKEIKKLYQLEGLFPEPGKPDGTLL